MREIRCDCGCGWCIEPGAEHSKKPILMKFEGKLYDFCDAAHLVKWLIKNKLLAVELKQDNFKLAEGATA